ncbi:MAG TPA: branched-chain amino acid ABC transporter permease [Chthoniobacteraceae bacterium]|jgi:branched-chain amino acid transport system permease protein|nr:branched-chain amino acid ABC transporter permease [Chthoniobacteraceae bacterium]
MIEFLQQLINGLSLGAIYALIALGYTMVYGVLRFINFAHGDVYMLGAFAGLYISPFVAKFLGTVADWAKAHSHLPGATLLLGAVGGDTPWTGALLVLLFAMVACAIAGIVIEKLAYRPLRNSPRLTVLITAIGVSLFLENFGQYAFGVDPQSFPDLIGDHAITLPAWFGPLTNLTVMVSQVLVFAATILLLIALWYIVTKTKLGTAMRALSVNPTATSLMGVNNDVVISFTFGLGSALAGAAGILISIQQPSIDPLMGLQPGINAFVAAVLGGIGNIPGAAFGGILIGVIQTLVVGYSDTLHIPSGYRDAVAFFLLILILLFKPTGLFGRVEREKV